MINLVFRIEGCTSNEINLIENTEVEETLYAEELITGVYYIEITSTSRFNGEKLVYQCAKWYFKTIILMKYN